MVNCFGAHQKGLRDWIFQRITALYLGVYVLFLTFYLVFTHPITYTGWSRLFSFWSMKIATILCFAAMLVHAWIGIWTILTDYVPFKTFRTGLYGLVWMFLLACLAWGIMIVWSV